MQTQGISLFSVYFATTAGHFHNLFHFTWFTSSGLEIVQTIFKTRTDMCVNSISLYSPVKKTDAVEGM